MTIHIHVTKEKRTKLEPSGKKGNFTRYKVSHMEIECEEQKAPKDDCTDPSILVDHSSYHQEESVEPEGPT
jgi:dihydroxyacetone kinase-like predicted kinase